MAEKVAWIFPKNNAYSSPDFLIFFFKIHG